MPLTLGAGLGRDAISRRLLVAGMAVAVLPDLDVAAWHYGIPYGSDYGHRGFSHSLLFAAVVAFAGALMHRALHSRYLRAFLFLFASCASHGVLDAFTNGGSGIALLWPFSSERYFAPVTPVEVSPIGVARFLSARGASVMLSEMLWIWLPCLALLALMAGIRFAQSRSSSRTG